MKRSSLLLLLFFALTASQCEKMMENFFGISLANKSENTVSFFFVKPGGDKLYPDTTLPDSKPMVVDVSSNKDRAVYLNAPYEDIFNALPLDTMSFYIFDSADIQGTEWTVVKDEYRILRRYDLSLNDLQVLNFIVPYPPTPAMNNMKMFPPYSN